MNNKNVTATILIVLAIGIYFTVTQDMYTEVKAIRAVNAEYSSAVASAEELIKARDKVRKDFSDISEADKTRLSKMLPDTVDNIRLVIDLNGVAQKHGFTLKNIKAAASSQGTSRSVAQPVRATPTNPGVTTLTVIPTPTLDTVTVSFSVSAPYEQFISLMQDLEANLRIMDVTRFTVTSSDTGIYDWNVELKTYWLRTQ